MSPASDLSTDPDTTLPTGSLVLDELFGGGLLPGLLTVVHSPKGPKDLRPLLIRVLLRHYHRQPVIIDTVNQFPALQLARLRQRPHLEILSQLHVARAFNYHQIYEAITRHLAETIHQTGSSVVILLGLAEQFFSAEAQQNLQYEGREPLFSLGELTEALGRLKALVLEQQLYCLILTSLAPHSRTKTLGGTFLGHCAGVIVQKHVHYADIHWTLVKHPAR